MEILIAESIRRFRKGRGLTQEQLAEAMGVTVGAVSRWESGRTVPEVSLIMELAAFFETSVDVLLGYGLQQHTEAEALEGIRAKRNAKRFDEAAAGMERVLLNYPNSFNTVFQAAILFSLKGMEQEDTKCLQRALELFRRSLELENQNTDVRVNRWTIRNHIADVLQAMGQTDKALEEMKQNNAAGLNDGKIGRILAIEKHAPEEALPCLANALLDGVTGLVSVAVGYVNAYGCQRKHGEAMEMLQWILQVLAPLECPGQVSYLDMISVQLLTCCVLVAADSGDMAGAERYLEQARQLAAAFDAAPTYGFTGMRFYHGEKQQTAFDDFGPTAAAGIVLALEKQSGDTPALLPLLEKLRAEEAH